MSTPSTSPPPPSPNTPSTDPPRSLIELLGPDVSRCGYCTRPHSSRAFGAWAHRLRVHDYQALVDAGWRRSGRYLYRPDLPRTCCPPFVIRLDAARFAPAPSHRRVLKRLRRAANTAPARADAEAPKHPREHRAHPPVPDDERKRLLARQPIVDAVNAAVEAVCPAATGLSFRVFPPRARADAPALVCNAAHLLAARARRSTAHREQQQQQQQQNQPQPPLEQNPEQQQPRHQKQSARRQQQQMRKAAAASAQMDWAQRLQLVLCERLPDWRVSVSHPGFLNFYRSGGAGAECHQQNAADGASTEKHGKAGRKLEYASGDSIGGDTGDGNHDFMDVDGETEHGLPPAEVLDDAAVKAHSAHADRLSARTRRAEVCTTADPSDMSELYLTPGNENSESAMQSAGFTESESLSPRTSDANQNVDDPDLAYKPEKIPKLAEGSMFSMELVPASYESEAYEIFRRYQMTVHNEAKRQCGRETYRRFLVDSPLVQEPVADRSGRAYGSFHILYRLKGRLFAVGVVDILPKCLSSVYLFYDPEFAKLSPGTLAALKEIEWVQKVGCDYPSLRFYYMGYYIHSCPKMRYKANFDSSDILCDESKIWVPAKQAQQVLDSQKETGVRLASAECRPATAAAEFEGSSEEVDEIVNESRFQLRFEAGETRIVSLRVLERFLATQFAEHVQTVRENLRKFVRLVGKTASQGFDHVP